MLDTVALVAHATNNLDSARKAALHAQHALSIFVYTLMRVRWVVKVVAGSVTGSRSGDGFIFIAAVLHDCGRLDMLPWPVGLAMCAGLTMRTGLIMSAGCWF